MPIPFIDIFAGPGGLGEGFSAFQDKKNNYCFKPTLSIEMEERAHQTLTLRSFFRQFRGGKKEVPETYYHRLQGKISTDELFNIHPEEAKAAQFEAQRIKLGGETLEDQPENVDQLIKLTLQGRNDWILLGGPPCQAYSLVGRSRVGGIREDDPRVQLYKEYLRIIVRHKPTAFVFENVRGLASSKLLDQGIFETILDSLEDPLKYLVNKCSYSLSCELSDSRYKLIGLSESTQELFDFQNFDINQFLVRSEQFGIPQNRHRLIIIGIREDINISNATYMKPQPEVEIDQILSGLPPLRSGLSKEEDSLTLWHTALLQAITPELRNIDQDVLGCMQNVLSGISLFKYDRGGEWIESDVSIGEDVSKKWFLDTRIKGVCNHSTRSHLRMDLYRYLFAASYAKVKNESPKLIDFPDALLPYHRNAKSGKFTDRFRVQLYGRPATTITSHISKDGHYFIHPDPTQCRSLTVREAARIQTFPDNYFFCGPRTSQYVQVGNAVPPLLAWQIAKMVFQILKDLKLQ